MDKRFLLFSGNDYYPEGGALDFKGAFKTLDLAIEAHDPNEYEYDGGWANVLDLETETVVKEFEMGVWRNRSD